MKHIKKKSTQGLPALLMALLMVAPFISKSQSEKVSIETYLQKLPTGRAHSHHTYRMTAIYTNLDLYGNFTGKVKIEGDYTTGLADGFAIWNNIFISNSTDFSGMFPAGAKQEYMENFKYVPSAKMLGVEAFKNFPLTSDAVFARNLIWDMMAIENLAWDFTDSLKLNQTFQIPQITGAFNMADIGTYAHHDVQLCWVGLSAIKNELCAVIEYRALDNKIKLSMEGLQSKGTEQYCGTTWVSLKTKSVEAAEMYSGTIQELEINGMKDKLLVKTIRDIRVEKIR